MKEEYLSIDTITRLVELEKALLLVKLELDKIYGYPTQPNNYKDYSNEFKKIIFNSLDTINEYERKYIIEKEIENG